MINYFLVLGGCIIYVLLQLNSVFAYPDFSAKTFIKTNLIPTLLNLITGCVLVLLKDDLVNLYPITPLSSLMLGVSGQAIFKKLSAMFDKKVDTIVGING